MIKYMFSCILYETKIGHRTLTFCIRALIRNFKRQSATVLVLLLDRLDQFTRVPEQKVHTNASLT